MTLFELRQIYHQTICRDIIRIVKKKGNLSYPNNADGSNKSSREIAWEILHLMKCKPSEGIITGQTAGNMFEQITKNFLEQTLGLLNHLRPGKWRYMLNAPISNFDQYKHLDKIQKAVEGHRELAITLGRDYVISPDIIISREPVSDEEVNSLSSLINSAELLADLTPLRQKNSGTNAGILHASISCKWTLRSDRAQNTRTEALNLIRNRKGRLPHIVAVTAEPTPIRIASLALGTGDIDCVYHFALNELQEAIKNLENEDQEEMLNMLIEGRRLRDISDLPFDLAI